jgi:hypothetical protein
MLCELCLLGSEYQFRYECERCHQVQSIPHPMWRYQPTAAAFGDTSWACHRRCGDYTHWRIVAEDVGRVPAQHAPEGWGMRETWLAAVRERRQQEIRGGGGGGGGEGGGGEGRTRPYCTIC